MTRPKVRVLLNPMAGAGAALRRLSEVRAALRDRGLEHDIVETQRPGDGARLGREAARDGISVLAVMGGDGTLNEVVQAYIDAEGRPVSGPAIALVPAGTGGDYRRTLGLSGGIDEAIGRIGTGDPVRVDLGALRLTGDDGARRVRAFVNVTSFGIGGVTDKLVNEAPKWMGGQASFFVGSLRAMMQYRNARVRVRIDGALFFEGPAFNVAIALGRYFGGGMKIAPDADPGDGKFDVVSLGDLSKLEALAFSRLIYAGRHTDHPKVKTARGARLSAEALSPGEHVLIDMDGETPGRLPLEAEVLPGALAVYAG